MRYFTEFRCSSQWGVLRACIYYCLVSGGVVAEFCDGVISFKSLGDTNN